MSDTLNWLASIAAGIVTTALLGALTYLVSVRDKRRREDSETEEQRRVRKEIREEVVRLTEKLNLSLDAIERDLVVELEPTSPPAGGHPEFTVVPKSLEGVMEALQERLARVERRFPKEATLEKIASINDAILATKIEYLERSLKELESRLLTKWDVAVILFAIIGAVGVIAGTIFAVANFVLK